MKLVCFDTENCSYVQTLTLEELNDYNLDKPFVKCPECLSLAIIAKDDFNPDDLDFNSAISSMLKLSKRKIDYD